VGVRGSTPRGGGNGGGVRGSMTWTDTARTRWLWAAPTAAGSACLAGAAGAGCEQGRTAACVTRNGAADRWGGSASERGSTARCADRRARQHSAARFGFKPIQTGSNGFKFGETLTDPKGAFPCLKNWK
jgi:hypothetical protein